MKTPMYLLLALTMSSCSKSVNNKPATYFNTKRIEINNDKRDLASALVDSISFVALKENDQSYFSAISKLDIIGNKIFIFDKLGRNTLLEFDEDGNFVRSYGEHGHGANELMRLWDFDVDSHFVYLYDRQKRKMLQYDHNGKHVKDITTDFIGDGFKILTDKGCLFSLAKGFDNIKLCVTSPDLKITTKATCFDDKDIDDKITDNLFHTFGKDIVYHKPVSDSVFSLSNDGKIKSCFIIDFKADKVPVDLSYSYEKLINNGGKRRYSYIYDCPMMAGKFMVCSIFHKGVKATLIVDTVTHQSDIIDWKDGVKMSDIILPVYACDKYIIGWMDEEVYNVISDKEKISPEMTQHLNNGGKILIYYHLRQS